MICKHKKRKGRCEILSGLASRNFFVADGWCVKYCKPNQPDIAFLKSTLPSEKKTQKFKEKQQKEITTAIAQLPPITQRLVSLDNWMKDIGVPFQQKTGLLFTSKDHKLQRDAICRPCPHMAKEGELMSCTKCGCRMGKLVADPNEPNPHEIMGKLGAKGKTADAIRIKSASWYMVKKCGNWKEDDRWLILDEKHMTEEQLGVKDELYTRNT